MEDEIKINTTFNTTDEYELEEPFTWYELILPITAFLGCIVCTTIVYIIYKNKLLHSRPYYCLAHFCICYALYLLLSPLVTEIVPRIYKHLPKTLYCMGAEVDYTAWFGTVSYLLILLLEWYIPVHCSRQFSSKYIRFSGFMSFFIATFVLSLLLVTIITCAHGFYFPMAVLFAFLAFLVAIIMIIILTILHFIKVKTMDIVAVDSNVILYIVVAYLLCWMGYWILLILLVSIGNDMDYFIFAVCAQCLTFLCPGIIFLILYKYDDKFRKCVNLAKSKHATEVIEDLEENKVDNQDQFQTLI